jgi:hypothetical protein
LKKKKDPEIGSEKEDILNTRVPKRQAPGIFDPRHFWVKLWTFLIEFFSVFET